MRRLASFFALALIGAGVARAESSLLDDRLTGADKDRLAAFGRVRAEAVAEAMAGGDAASRAELERVMAGAAQPILGRDIRGDYTCRTVKLGGNLPLVIYGWFRCRIDEDDQGYRLTKSSGSQRFTGHLVDADERFLVFWGAGHMADEAPGAYGADPERTIVGRLVRTGEGRFRLEIPLPHVESKFDIIELRRS